MPSLAVNVSYAQMTTAPGSAVPHYFGPYPNYATSQLPIVTYDTNGTITSVSGGIRKFIDSLPGLGSSNANNLGEYIPVAVPDSSTYPGCDYYEIAVVEFKQQMHSDLGSTRLRGYVQLETPANYALSKHVALTYLNGTQIKMPNGKPAIAVDNPLYLGPVVVAQRDRPVRLTFTNLLPTGMDGNLFLPVDTTVMGAGDGPKQIGTDSSGNPIYEQYTQNRATVHLHGGNTPWISDGTPHQWVTPAGENTSYPKGVAVQYVPDMWFVNGTVIANTTGVTSPPTAGATNNPGSGSLTFYYTNQQSARLLFYHDHSYGITRLTVYSGEVAPYIVRDSVESELMAAGVIPSTEIPLILQDKTFVPDNTIPVSNMFGNFPSQLAFQDPTWNTSLWGKTSDLWYPHVYMTNQNPYDPSGTNPFGRWDYSAWFWPPYQPMMGPVANPYYNASNPSPMEPPMIPGVPNVSMTGEAFMDTPVINGAAYPYLTVQPQAYRFRILNGADDRFWNLQWYIADNTTTTFDGRVNTEVKMVPAVYNSTYPSTWPIDGRAGGVPDPTMQGPNFIQIGTEGGFLPAPVVIPNQPIDWNRDMRTFDFGNVNKNALLLGTAERADVIVDFSQFAGKTLILYNDAPAPFPAIDPRQDHYTGDPDLTASGGPSTTIAGYGPNTRTIMQVRVVNTTSAASFNITALNTAFAPNSTTQGVFVRDQKPILVPQAAYGAAYNTTFADIWGTISDSSLTFTPVNATSSVTLALQPKSLHDEMGAAYEPMYGRMQGMLGVEIPKSSPQTATTILYNYADPPTEVVSPSLQSTLIGAMNDGTQIWRITHNGIDTHSMHWHMYDVQLINRVAWDNTVHMPDANEIGWKDTVRINPLTDTYIALRPILPQIPFDIPNSIRPIDPTQPLGAVLKTSTFIQDPTGEPITLTNHLVNYGWEYMWHCHILAHEDMDMMRPVAVAVAPRAPSNLVVTTKGSTAILSWIDNSLSETGFTIQRATDPAFTTGIVTFIVGANVTSYQDATIKSKVTYYYRVQANNVVGDTFVYSAPAAGFPTKQADSSWSNTVLVGTPAVPSNLKATSVSRTSVTLTWTDNSKGFAGFIIQRATNSGFSQNLQSFTVGAGTVTYTDNTVSPNTRYYYRIAATFAGSTSAWSSSISVTTPA